MGLPFPVGRKNEAVTMDETRRFPAVPIMPDYKGAIEKGKAKNGYNVIGDGIVSPPPCSPQPICRMWEGLMPEPLLLLRWKHRTPEHRRKRSRQAGETFLFECSPL